MPLIYYLNTKNKKFKSQAIVKTTLTTYFAFSNLQLSKLNPKLMPTDCISYHQKLVDISTLMLRLLRPKPDFKTAIYNNFP